VRDRLGPLREEQDGRLAKHDRSACPVGESATDEVVGSGWVTATAGCHRSRQLLRIERGELHRCATSLRAQDKAVILDRVDLVLGELRGRVADPVGEAVALDHDRARRALDFEHEELEAIDHDAIAAGLRRHEPGLRTASIWSTTSGG
jgi:hypothetical protein